LSVKDIAEFVVDGMKLPYWIQRADFSSRHFDPIDVVGAEAILLGHDWRKERTFLKSLENEGKAIGEDCCTPGVGFIRGKAILHIVPHEDRTADCYVLGALSPYALQKGERHGNVVCVTDPDANRAIEGASILLQLRLLQLQFRGDDDGLQYLCDEYIRPAR
jgi:hypothetical protein